MTIAVGRAARRWAASVNLKVWGILGVAVAANGMLHFEAVEFGRWVEDRREHGLDQAEAISVLIPPGRLPRGSSISLEKILRDYHSEGGALQLRFIPLSGGIDSLRPRAAPRSLASSLPVDEGAGAYASKASANPEKRCSLDEGVVLAALGAETWPGRLVDTFSVPDGCWVLLSIPAPAREVESAGHLAAIQLYCLSATLIAIALAMGVFGRLKAHARVMREMGQRRLPVPLSEVRCPAPELEGDIRCLNQLLHELHQLSDDIRQAAEDDAHDLKAPLGLIKLAHRRIRRTLAGNSADDPAGLKVAEEAANRMMLSIEAAQALAEERAALAILPRGQVDLGSTVDRCCRSLEPAIELKCVRLIIDRRDDIVLSTGVGLLEMLLADVLENAVEASPEEGEVVVELRVEEEEAVIAVADSGPGINSMSRDALFARKPLGEAGTEGPRPGGRCYFSAKRSADLLGGSIMVDNRPAGGVLVVVYLPI